MHVNRRNGLQMRKNSWQDGVRGTNCPILPGTNWTYRFQIKDQIGSYFYFPTLLFQKAAGGFGSIRVYSPELVPVPFPQPDGEFDILIGDWFNNDYRVNTKIHLYSCLISILLNDVYYLLDILSRCVQKKKRYIIKMFACFLMHLCYMHSF